MSWRDKVQTMREGVNSQKCATPSLPKPPKPSSVSFGSTPPPHIPEKTGVSGHPANRADFPENLRKPVMTVAANDPALIVGLVANLPVARLVASKVQVSSGEVSTLVSIQPAAIPDPDHWCWPHSSAMTGREIDTMAERTHLFNRRGLAALEAELLAYRLVTRDREADDRRLCLECVHLGRAGGALRCAQWQRAGLGAPGVPAGLHLVLQRCDSFKDQTPRGGGGMRPGQTPPDPNAWRELAAAYNAHHFKCSVCIAAGRGAVYGLRCGVGAALWNSYQNT